MNMHAVLVHDTEGLAHDWPALRSSETLNEPSTAANCRETQR